MLTARPIFALHVTMVQRYHNCLRHIGLRLNVMVGNYYTAKLIMQGVCRARQEVIMMTSIGFHLGNRRIVFAHPLLLSLVKLKISVSKLKKFRRFEYSPKMFAHLSLKPCRRPWFPNLFVLLWRQTHHSLVCTSVSLFVLLFILSVLQHTLNYLHSVS